MGHDENWEEHPSVRTGEDLSFGEKAADRLKSAFGSWGFLIGLNTFIVAWVVANILLPHTDRWDVYPFILMNLFLSWLAAQQGGALQIAANRGDKVSSEVAMHTYENGQELLQINRQQSKILELLRAQFPETADKLDN